MSTYQKVVYSGNLSEYQTKGNRYVKHHVVYEKDKFNQYQNFLYKRALYGMSVYSEEEQSKMHWDKKKRIMKVHERAQYVLNEWKQKITHRVTSGILGELFHHSTFIKEYSEKFADVVDPKYISPLDFKSLGISKDEIVEKLIQEKILPANFYQLTEPV